MRCGLTGAVREAPRGKHPDIASNGEQAAKEQRHLRAGSRVE